MDKIIYEINKIRNSKINYEKIANDILRKKYKIKNVNNILSTVKILLYLEKKGVNILKYQNYIKKKLKDSEKLEKNKNLENKFPIRKENRREKIENKIFQNLAELKIFNNIEKSIDKLYQNKKYPFDENIKEIEKFNFGSIYIKVIIDYLNKYHLNELRKIEKDEYLKQSYTLNKQEIEIIIKNIKKFITELKKISTKNRKKRKRNLNKAVKYIKYVKEWNKIKSFNPVGIFTTNYFITFNIKKNTLKVFKTNSNFDINRTQIKNAICYEYKIYKKELKQFLKIYKNKNKLEKFIKNKKPIIGKCRISRNDLLLKIF